MVHLASTAASYCTPSCMHTSCKVCPATLASLLLTSAIHLQSCIQFAMMIECLPGCFIPSAQHAALMSHRKLTVGLESSRQLISRASSRLCLQQTTRPTCCALTRQECLKTGWSAAWSSACSALIGTTSTFAIPRPCTADPVNSCMASNSGPA